jgi:hypothetical protein
MIQLKPFIQFLQEGGNVKLGDHEAQAIDLTSHSRKDIVPEIAKGLESINAAFEKQHGLPLWNKQLFSSREFLSGSAFHFFDLEGIKDEEFVKAKKSVGDIDTQVDGNMKEMVKTFLKNASSGKKFGPLNYLGFKESAGQFISLWELSSYGIKIQVDLELVEYNPQTGRPTAWSTFSHGSAWEDLKEGIKGVGHKYLMSSIAHIGSRDVIIKGKTDRSKDKVVSSSDKTFSVQYGLRTKLAPVTNEQGKHAEVDGLKVYKEMSPQESGYENDLSKIFTEYFGRVPTSADLKEMGSFIGLLNLIASTMKQAEKEKIFDSFFNKLWGSGAQGLYRGDKEKDYREKTIMARTAVEKLGISGSKDIEYETQVEKYYKGYK